MALGARRGCDGEKREREAEVTLARANLCDTLNGNPRCPRWVFKPAPPSRRLLNSLSCPPFTSPARMFARACSSRPPRLQARSLALSPVTRAEPTDRSSLGPPLTLACLSLTPLRLALSLAFAGPTSRRSSSSAGSSQQPRLGDSRGRGRSEGGVNLRAFLAVFRSGPISKRRSARAMLASLGRADLPPRLTTLSFPPTVTGRGEAGSALAARPSLAPSGSRPRMPRPSPSSSPGQFDDAPASFVPRADLVRRDRENMNAAQNKGAYRSATLTPAVRLASAGSHRSEGGAGGEGGYSRGGLKSGGRGGRGGARGGGGAGRGGGRGGGGARSSNGSRKSPAYTGEAFLSQGNGAKPALAPATLPSNVDLYSTDDFLLSSAADKPVASGPSESFPPKTPFYEKLRAEVYAEGPTSGLRVLKHRTNNEHLLAVASLGPAALGAAQKLVGELPMLLTRGAKREDQGLASQTVEELDPESKTWKPAGKVDYTAELSRRFDPYKPGKPHPRRVFRLTTHATLVEDADDDPLPSDPKKGEGRKALYRSKPAIQLVTLEHPPVPDPTGSAEAHAELLAQIDAERAKGDYGRWTDVDALAAAAGRFVAAAGEGDSGAGAFKQGRKAALDLTTLGLGWSANGLSGRERALQKAVIEGLVKQ